MPAHPFEFRGAQAAYAVEDHVGTRGKGWNMGLGGIPAGTDHGYL